jgi:uncharacterized protein involved in exopolysaccharide biosynthesis
MQLAPVVFLKTQWGWRLAFLTVAVLILVGLSVYALTRPDLYQSEARILVMPEQVYDGKLSFAEQRDSFETQVHNMQGMLGSRSFWGRIIEEFQLSGYGSRPDFRLEAAIAILRSRLRVEAAVGNSIVLSFIATDPQAAQEITKRIVNWLLQSNSSADKSAAIEREQFLDEQLRMAEHELAAIDERIAQIKNSHVGEPQQQSMLREQARLQRHVDEIDRMKFNAKMTANLVMNKYNRRLMVIDPANLPELPIPTARLRILMIGIGAALIVALPAALMKKKAPRESA